MAGLLSMFFTDSVDKNPKISLHISYHKTVLISSRYYIKKEMIHKGRIPGFGGIHTKERKMKSIRAAGT